MNRRFEWAVACRDAVVRPQAATVAFWNEGGDITIRQECDAYSDEDAIVVLTPPNAAELARFILTDLLGQERSIALLTQIWSPDGKPKRRLSKPNENVLTIESQGEGQGPLHTAE